MLTARNTYLNASNEMYRPVTSATFITATELGAAGLAGAVGPKFCLAAI